MGRADGRREVEGEGETTMTTCPTVPLDLSSPYSTLLDPKSPTEITRRGIDWTEWLACNNPGATITAAPWTIHPDDDDATLTLSQETLSGAVATVLITGGTVNKSYRLINTVAVSDGQSILATVQIHVRDVYKQALAA